MTGLEAINEKLQKIKSESLEKILSVSGSAAITKNEYGINVVDSNNVASSLVFKELTKDKYDNEELKKAVDVEVKELLPNIPSTNLDLVPRPIYNAELTTSLNLRTQVINLTNTIGTLNVRITDLESSEGFHPGKKLYVPAGTYNITGTIYIPKHTTIIVIWVQFIIRNSLKIKKNKKIKK